MKVFYAFCQKEQLETHRTKKIWLLLVIFSFFGLMNPLVAKLMPDILKMSFGENVPIPTPTSLDSWTQFYKNISQIGIYLFAIIFSGIVSQEIAKGTLITLTTKGLKRGTVILSKWFVLCGQWLLSIFVYFGITYGYTLYYFPDQNSPHPWLAVAPLVIFGLFFSSVIVFTSVLANNQFEGLILTVLVMVVGYLANLFEAVKNWNPISLIGQNLAILQDKSIWSDLWPSLVLTSILAVILLFGAILIFKNKKI